MKNILNKLFKIFQECEAIEKDTQVGGQYKATSEKETLNTVKPLLKKYKVMVLPFKSELLDKQVKFYTSKGYKKVGNDWKEYEKMNSIIVDTIKYTFNATCTESGEMYTYEAIGTGYDQADKGAGKAATYAQKIGILKLFMLFSGEDTDNTHSDDIVKGTEVKQASGTTEGKMLRRKKITPEGQKNWLPNDGLDIIKKGLKAVQKGDKSKEDLKKWLNGYDINSEAFDVIKELDIELLTV